MGCLGEGTAEGPRGVKLEGAGTTWAQVRECGNLEQMRLAPLSLERSVLRLLRWEVPPPKEAISLRVDGDVLAWFRAGGPGYQSRMNAVLRSYMTAMDEEADEPARLAR